MAETILESLGPNYNRQKRDEIKLKLVKPSGEVLIFESEMKVQKISEEKKMVEYRGRVQTKATRMYRIEGLVTYAMRHYPWRMFVEGKALIEVPKVSPIHVQVASNVDVTGRDKEIMYKVSLLCVLGVPKIIGKLPLLLKEV